MKRLLILFASLAVLGLVAAQTLRTLSYDPDTGIVLWGGGTNALTLPASVSPSWQLLPATNGISTITTNEFGVGWDDQGRFTLSTPAGMIQMYGSGDPVQPTLYFNGTLVAQRFDAININGIVYAKNIEGGAGSPGGIISPPIIEDSFLGPFRQWTSGKSSSNGVPWGLTTNGFSAPIPGNYIPYVDAGVDDETGQTVKFEGRYASPEDFMEMMPMPRSGAAPTNAVLQADGNGGSAFVGSRVDTRRVTNDITRVSWAANVPQQGANQLTNELGSWTLDANSVYRVDWAVRASVENTNAMFLHGTSLSGPLTEQSSSHIGFGTAPTAPSPAVVAYSSSLSYVTLPSGSWTGNRFMVGYAYLVTTSGITMTYGFCPSSNSTNAVAILSNSVIRVEKIAP